MGVSWLHIRQPTAREGRTILPHFFPLRFLDVRYSGVFLRGHHMLLTTPPDLDIRSPWTAQDMWLYLVESLTLSRQVCEEAKAACVTAAQLRQETAQLRHSALHLRTIAAQHRAEGMHRRQKGL